MPSFCVVSNCEYKYATTGGISFHKFPLNSPELLQKWIDFTDRGPDWLPSKWSSICSRHFLPSDFRNLNLRKSLKKTAFPSIIIKSLDFNSIPTTNFNENHFRIKKISCRLCAKKILDYSESKSIHQMSSLLVKCFPTIHVVENLPNQICCDCIKKLTRFSIFFDRVTSVQNSLFGCKDAEEMLRESTKPIIIKQEPVTNIKQEIFEFNKSTRNIEDLVPISFSTNLQDGDTEIDAYCEFCEVYFTTSLELKNHILDFHSDNSRERVNNCEIMEIITLENPAFIDLAENCVDEIVPLKPELKVEKITDTDNRDMLIKNIAIEHNYATSCLPLESTGNTSMVRCLKQEVMKIQVRSLIQTEPIEEQLEPDSFDIATAEPINYEVIETEDPTIKCTKCNDVFESEQFLNEHMASFHIPKTKICPICTAHCKTIYHYFIHRSKYHNWSKPRRMKQKYFICVNCSKIFLTKFALDNHGKHSCSILQFKCSICELEFDKWMSMQVHKRKCKVLMRKFDSADSSSKCNKQRKLQSSSAKEIVKRPLNPRQRTKKVRPVRHQSREELKKGNINGLNAASKGIEYSKPNKRREYPNVFETLDKFTDNNQFICSSRKRFKTFSKGHKKGHNSRSQSMHVCEICQKGFRVSSNLYQHLVTHEVERKHKCSLCSKAFKRLAGLNQHVRGYHYKIKPHVCKICEHSYALKGDMRRCRHSDLQNKN